MRTVPAATSLRAHYTRRHEARMARTRITSWSRATCASGMAAPHHGVPILRAGSESPRLPRVDEPFDVVLKRTGERVRIDADPTDSPRARIDVPGSPPGTPAQPPADATSSQSAIQPRATIDAFHQSLAALRAADLANTELQQASADLYAAAHAARDAGFQDEVQEVLDAAAETAPPRLKMPLNSAYLQEEDREFRHHDAASLDIRRVEFTGGLADVRDLELTCNATAAGSFVPKVTRPGEQAILSIACAHPAVREQHPGRLGGRGTSRSRL